MTDDPTRDPDDPPSPSTGWNEEDRCNPHAPERVGKSGALSPNTEEKG